MTDISVSIKEQHSILNWQNPWFICIFIVLSGSPVGPFNQTTFYKCFSGGTFQLRYYFWTLLEATLLSIQHTYELLLYVSNSPVQFCPSPVYPAWQSHTCDPKVFLQFAFSWQEWFPLHSSTSMNQQMERRVSKVCKNCRASTML